MLLERFEDPDRGGFFFSDAEAEVPVQRLRPLQDDALPSGNGVAAQALNTLGHLTGEPRLLDSAHRTLAGAEREMREQPLAHARLLRALGDVLAPPGQLIILGSDEAKVSALEQAARSAAAPGRLDCYRIGAGDDPLPGILAQVDFSVDAAACLCRGLSCLPPVHDPARLSGLIEEGQKP